MKDIRTISEQELADICKKGGRAAAEELYRRYAPGLFPVCLRYCSCTQDAEDLLQDSFIKLFTAIKTFTYRGSGSLRGWMTRVIVNEAISRLRKSSLHTAPITDDIEVSDDDNGSLPEGLTSQELIGFIQELPDGYRSVLNLYVFEGKSHKEIASLLGIAENSSTSQLHRAKKMLKERIEQYVKDKKNGQIFK